MTERMFLGAVGQEAKMADTHEAIEQDVEQEAADEFVGLKSHCLFSICVFSIPVPPEADQPLAEAEGDLAVLDVEDAVIG